MQNFLASLNSNLRLLLALALLAALPGCETLAPRSGDGGPIAPSETLETETPPTPDENAASVEENTAPAALEAVSSQLSEIQAQLDAINSRLAEPPPAPPAAAASPAREIECPAVPREQAADPMKTMLGTLEWIYLDPPGRLYRARVDSGANTSSISASDVREFERDGEDWVRFTFDHDGDDPLVTIERPVQRVVLIRQASAEQPDRRPVVLLTVQLGDLVQKTEFTLADRSQMTYPVLLGREFLLDLYLIDVSEAYLHGKPETKTAE